METHFVYAGRSHFNVENKLRISMVKKMKKYNIKKVMVTRFDMQRIELITKEKMENYCKGNEIQKKSINDDLESFFDDIRLGKETNNTRFMGSYHVSYCLPKLTQKELKLVAKKDEHFMNGFFMVMNADVDKAEMELSESDSKYVYARCRRKTSTIESS